MKGIVNKKNSQLNFEFLQKQWSRNSVEALIHKIDKADSIACTMQLE